MIWYVNFSLGTLGRLNPRTGEVKEWPSPSGQDTQPVRDHGRQRHHLVQRVAPPARCAGTVRPEDGAIPKLGDSVRRRHASEHARDRRRQPADPPDQHEPDRFGHDQPGKRPRAAGSSLFRTPCGWAPRLCAAPAEGHRRWFRDRRTSGLDVAAGCGDPPSAIRAPDDGIESDGSIEQA